MLVDFYRVLFIHSQFQLLALLFMAGATFAPSLEVFAGININLLIIQSVNLILISGYSNAMSLWFLRVCLIITIAQVDNNGLTNNFSTCPQVTVRS